MRVISVRLVNIRYLVRKKNKILLKEQRDVYKRQIQDLRYYGGKIGNIHDRSEAASDRNQTLQACGLFLDTRHYMFSIKGL